MELRQFTDTSLVGTSFHIREWIPDKTPLAIIFLLHGLADHGGRFIPVAEAFTESGFVFFAPDLRGNGLSSGKRGHFSSVGQLMKDIDHLFGLCRQRWPSKPIIIYGQSMGGNLALNYCLRFQPEIAGCIASSPWLKLTHPPNPVVKFLGSLACRIFPSMTIPNGLNADDLSHSTSISQAYRSDPLVHGRISLKTFEVISSLGESALENADEFSSSLLLMHGTADNITSIEASKQFAEKIHVHLTFKIFEGMKHEIHNEPPDNQPIRYLVDQALSFVQPILNKAADSVIE